MATLLENIVSLNNYLSTASKPLLIAGPCSAESEAQVLETAVALAQLPQVAAFRLGLWKPRSRPGDFEGAGSAGLPWLAKVKRETGLPVMVEVALPAHIEACLGAGVDILWIGSRTVVNPFSVEEIAAALKGAEVPVFVKNPVSPDLPLWIGALERLHRQGIRKLAAVHRGFSVYGSKPYRNLPIWEIPIELRRLAPELPVLVDPSHIGGSPSMVRHVAQAAIDLAFDGLMLESHIRPGEALTDRDQQLSPGALLDMLGKLNPPKEKKGEEGPLIENLRSGIDDLDKQILDLFSKRMDIVQEIGALKRSEKMDYLQLERWKEVVGDRVEKGMALGLSRNFLMKMLRAVHEEALRVQSGKKKD